MDKNKIIEAAAKLVAKGAYDKAIKEYQRILDSDPKDVRILQKMGELYQKKNDNVQAAGYFTRVAESYSTDGFFLKAVALYKQVLKLDPTLMDINVRLAELHQQLQLTGEAMAYYQIVANHYDKSGDTRRSLEVLKKMADLDPDNVASRVKLADLYVREGMTSDAVSEFKGAAEHLKRNNRIDDYLRVAERLSSLQPDDLDLARELAELYLQRNDQKRALAKLQVCFKADNRDIATLRLLAVAFQGLGQMSKTVSVYKELARAYEDKGQGGDADQVWQQVAELDPNDPDVQARLQPAVPAVQAAPAATAPEAVPAYAGSQQPSATQARTALAPAAAPKPDSNIPKLLTETDVYVKYGLHDKALEHLRKVFGIDPENIDAHEKAYAIYVASNNHAQASEQLLNVLRLHTRSGDAQRAQPYLQTILQQNPGHPEVPVFLSALQVAGGMPAAAPVQDAEVAEDAILVDSTDDEVIVAEAPEVISGEVALADAAVLDAEEVLDDEPVAVAQPWDDAEVVSEEPGYDDVEPATGEHEAIVDDDEFPTQATQLPMTTQPGFEAGPALGDEDEHEAPTRVGMNFDPSMMRTNFNYRSPAAGTPALDRDEVVEDPFEEPPASTLDEPVADQPWEDEPPQEQPWQEEEQPAWQAEAPEPIQPISEISEISEVSELTPPPQEDPFAADASASEEAVVAPPEEQEPASEECEEAAFFVEQGLYDEAREILETIMVAYPDHRRAGELLAQIEAMEATGGAPAPAGANGAEDRDAFDLAQELADELGDFGGEAAAPESFGGGGDDYQVSVDEVFAEFKKGLEKVVKPEDVDTHYDLGIAYKEMGLVEDAIGEFTIARQGCEGKPKEVDCLTMVGMLNVMRGDFNGAIDTYKQALTTPHAKGEKEKALRYELGGAFEGAGEAGKALGQYMRVQSIDGGYRDVAQMVERLSAIASPEDDEGGGPKGPPPPKGGGPRGGGSGSPPRTRKVGYL